MRVAGINSACVMTSQIWLLVCGLFLCFSNSQKILHWAGGCIGDGWQQHPTARPKAHAVVFAHTETVHDHLVSILDELSRLPVAKVNRASAAPGQLNHGAQRVWGLRCELRDQTRGLGATHTGGGLEMVYRAVWGVNALGLRGA